MRRRGGEEEAALLLYLCVAPGWVGVWVCRSGELFTSKQSLSRGKANLSERENRVKSPPTQKKRYRYMLKRHLQVCQLWRLLASFPGYPQPPLFTCVRMSVETKNNTDIQSHMNPLLPSSPRPHLLGSRTSGRAASTTGGGARPSRR